MLGAGVARAEPVAVAVVVAGRASMDAPVSPALAEDAVARAAGVSGAQVVQAPFARARARLARGAVAAARLQGFGHARALAHAGWRAYLAVEPAAAAQTLARARDAARAVLDLQGGRALHADISLRLGVVLHQLGRADEAAAALREAAALDPGRVVSIAAFAPDAVSAYEAARDAPAAAVTVRIQARPAGAAIELDGRPVGTAPIEVTVPAGPHAIVARAPGYRDRGQVVAIAPGQGPVDIRLDADALAAAVLRGPEALAVGRAPDQAGIAVAGLARYAEVDAVVLVASVWRRGAPALLGQRCVMATDAAVRCTRVAEIGYDSPDAVGAAAARLWAVLAAAPSTGAPGLLMDARLLQAEPRPRPRVAREDGCAWCRSPWVWVGVGAAAAVGGAVWALARDQDTTPVVSVDPCMFGACEP